MASFEPQDVFDPQPPPPRPTTPPVRRGFLVVLAILSLAAILVYGLPYVAERTGYAYEAGRARAATEALYKLEKEGHDKDGVVLRTTLFRLAAAAVSPAVVHIETGHRRREGDGRPVPVGAANWLDSGFEKTTAGSGFVIDTERGYIVTNAHVVNDEVVKVRLSQGGEVPARVIGTDPKTDLAVIQVHVGLRRAAEWGDSSTLEPGDAVLAIGSPYMLDHSVTAGIISATGRHSFGQDLSVEFLQTDAKINPGNSGGPLVDLSGKVVGITTAIFTAEHSESEGIGLAIPAKLAKRVVEGLINGRATHGFIGVQLDRMSPAFAKQVKLPENTQGAFVQSVLPNAPAARAGLLPGDVIVKFADKDVTDQNALKSQVDTLKIDTSYSVQYYRAGKLQTTEIKIAEKPTALPLEPLGFSLFQLPPGRAGNPIGALIIDQVVRGSPADRAGLRPGMKLIGIGKTRIHTKAEYDAAIAKTDPTRKYPFEIQLLNGEIKFFDVGTDAQETAR